MTVLTIIARAFAGCMMAVGGLLLLWILVAVVVEVWREFRYAWRHHRFMRDK